MSDNIQIAQPNLNDAFKYVSQIKQLFKDEPSNYEYFVSSLYSYFQEKIDERTLIVRMENLFQRYPEMRNEFYWYCSPGWNTQSQEENFENKHESSNDDGEMPIINYHNNDQTILKKEDDISFCENNSNNYWEGRTITKSLDENNLASEGLDNDDGTYEALTFTSTSPSANIATVPVEQVTNKQVLKSESRVGIPAKHHGDLFKDIRDPLVREFSNLSDLVQSSDNSPINNNNNNNNIVINTNSTSPYSSLCKFIGENSTAEIDQIQQSFDNMSPIAKKESLPTHGLSPSAEEDSLNNNNWQAQKQSNVVESSMSPSGTTPTGQKLRRSTRTRKPSQKALESGY